MGITAPCGLHQFVDDMLRRSLVRVTHAEIDDVLTRGPGLLLQVANDIENVGWEAFNPPKLVVHFLPALLGVVVATPL